MIGLLLHLSQLLLRLRDLFLVELVRELVRIDVGANAQHEPNDYHCRQKYDEVVNGGGKSVMGAQLKIGPPMQTLHEIEEPQHAENLKPVARGILVH